SDANHWLAEAFLTRTKFRQPMSARKAAIHGAFSPFLRVNRPQDFTKTQISEQHPRRINISKVLNRSKYN
ncbi:MAG: hypothetical protein J2P54_22685, partial [Bradyrhizobiaceae bacterium]|nr:hypothetical protein [Bradyrhizobiaceae bacterium]